jgi:Uma2 family endonuclease
MGIDCERAGSSTYRTSEDEVGVEGDETFYFGVHAEPMRGPVNIDLSTQPPPDLAIQVEVTLPADDAILVYGQLGVPEVWRLDVNSWTLTFCIRLEDGSYAGSSRGLALPWLEAAEILAQIRLAEDLGASNWYAHINEWARVTILPRMAEG